LRELLRAQILGIGFVDLRVQRFVAIEEAIQEVPAVPG